jgi:hypothetical protein
MTERFTVSNFDSRQPEPLLASLQVAELLKRQGEDISSAID